MHSKCVCPERESKSNCNSTGISDESKRKSKDENIKLVEPPRKLKKGPSCFYRINTWLTLYYR